MLRMEFPTFNWRPQNSVMRLGWADSVSDFASRILDYPADKSAPVLTGPRTGDI